MVMVGINVPHYTLIETKPGIEEDCLQIPLVISRASAKRKKAANNRCRGVLAELFAGVYNWSSASSTWYVK